MLTVNFDRLAIEAGDWVLDIGCGFGRHAYQAAALGANVVACDLSVAELAEVTATTFAMSVEKNSLPIFATAGDITDLPFADGAFDKIIASEVLEHIGDDIKAMNELFRVLAPNGTLAVTVPAYIPEKICWSLSDEYYAPKAEGGHIRIYTKNEIRHKLAAVGFSPTHSHCAHALHSPYWWLRCLVGPNNDANRLVATYHKFLCWELMNNPPITRAVETVLNPILGKSFVVYAGKN